MSYSGKKVIDEKRNSALLLLIDLHVLYLVNTDWYLSNFEARVIFCGFSAKHHDIRQFSACTNVVSFSYSVSVMKLQQTKLSYLSSNNSNKKS